MSFLQQIDFRARNTQSIVATNIVLVILAVVLDWQISQLMFFFWIENIILGFYSVLQMIFYQGQREQKIEFKQRFYQASIVKLFFVPFFLMHFGFFCFIHGKFIEVFFGNGIVQTSPELMSWDNVWALKYGILAIFINYGISFVTNYLGKGEYKTASIFGLIINPYRRIFIIQLLIIGSGFIFIFFLSKVPSIAFILFFFGVKMILDLRQEKVISSGELPKFMQRNL